MFSFHIFRINLNYRLELLVFFIRLSNEQKEIYVILWMEHEIKNTTPIGNSVYLQVLKKKLQWLTDRNNILICNHTNCPTSLKIKA